MHDVTDSHDRDADHRDHGDHPDRHERRAAGEAQGERDTEQETWPAFLANVRRTRI